MIEYSVKAYDLDQEDKLIRAVHADDLCAAVWDIRELLQRAVKNHPDEECQNFAFSLLKEVNEILTDTGADAAMDHYT